MARSAGFLWRWYLAQLSRRPLLTQAWSTGIISGVGDILAQQMVEEKTVKGHEWRRTFHFSLVGLVFVGPTLRTWFVTLERYIGPSRSSAVALKKMVLDQFCFAPVFFACLLPILWFSQGLEPNQIALKLKQDYATVLITNYKIWPAVQMVNFYLVPLNFRVNFANVVAVGWNAYLSWQAHHTGNAEETPE